MSRNEMFLLLACAFVAAIMSGSPVSAPRQQTVTFASLLGPAPDNLMWTDSMTQHGFDRQ